MQNQKLLCFTILCPGTPSCLQSLASCLIIRPHYSSNVAYCYKQSSMVCLSVGHAVQKRLNWSRCPSAGCLMWTKGTMYYMGVKIPHGKRQFLEVDWLNEQHWEPLLQCTQQKGSSPITACSSRDHSILNNGMTCDAAFHQNCLTACH